jgi:hypothetical protein
MKFRIGIYIICIGFLWTSCGPDKEVTDPYLNADPAWLCGTEAAYAQCLTPKFSPEYYIDQGVKYFLTMESTVPIEVVPNYADNVVRWEWPPWLLLTGFRKNGLLITDVLLKLNPTSYDLIDCRFFEEQPFCRCHVIFNYSGDLCPIYEEFTFNDQGEITFIEAWSDYPTLIPMDVTDYWAEGENVIRLATRVPGLGNEEGRINIHADYMSEAAALDADLAEMVYRCKQPITTWLELLVETFEEVEQGCFLPEGDYYPYYP